MYYAKCTRICVCKRQIAPDYAYIPIFLKIYGIRELLGLSFTLRKMRAHHVSITAPKGLIARQRGSVTSAAN